MVHTSCQAKPEPGQSGRRCVELPAFLEMPASFSAVGRLTTKTTQAAVALVLPGKAPVSWLQSLLTCSRPRSPRTVFQCNQQAAAHLALISARRRLSSRAANRAPASSEGRRRRGGGGWSRQRNRKARVLKALRCGWGFSPPRPLPGPALRQFSASPPTPGRAPTLRSLGTLPPSEVSSGQ